jgi:hypothetical protein
MTELIGLPDPFNFLQASLFRYQLNYKLLLVENMAQTRDREIL